MSDHEKDLEILKEWILKEPHLPQKIDDALLRRFLHTCNFSIEQSKHLIDLFFTIRTHAPEIFADRDPLCEEIREVFENMDFIPLPKQTEKNYKLLLYNINNRDPDKYNFVWALKAFFDLADVRMLTETEIPEGEIPIFDMQNFTVRHLPKVVLPVLKKYMVYTQEAHPIKLKEIHLLNVPPFLDKCMTIVRPFMKSEVAKMIHTHLPKSTTIYDYVPKELLPKEYGGNAGTVKDLKKMWYDRIIEHRDYLLDESRWTVNESKRPQNNNNHSRNTFGMEGSFRSLSID